MFVQQPADRFGHKQQSEYNARAERKQHEKVSADRSEVQRERANDKAFQVRHDAVIEAEHEQDHRARNARHDHRARRNESKQQGKQRAPHAVVQRVDGAVAQRRLAFAAFARGKRQRAVGADREIEHVLAAVRIVHALVGAAPKPVSVPGTAERAAGALNLVHRVALSDLHKPVGLARVRRVTKHDALADRKRVGGRKPTERFRSRIVEIRQRDHQRDHQQRDDDIARLHLVSPDLFEQHRQRAEDQTRKQQDREKLEAVE